ncbi:hypothetical protein [Psychrobacter lutiphocae]|uniref:hypothetical protein n=1 Tax=Psychrobacter lutiphocae TaxID=540500 RepID=UPI0003811FFA|nr:hypothetical protein [Psychrobacter lutiphocae]
MAASKETYEKVIEHNMQKGDKEWAKAKNGEGGKHYHNAKKSYNTAEKARKALDELDK